MTNNTKKFVCWLKKIGINKEFEIKKNISIYLNSLLSKFF